MDAKSSFLVIPKEDLARRALKYAKWKNFPAQLTYYINVKYWMRKARILVRPNDRNNGLLIVLIGQDLNWKTECFIE